MTGGSVPRAGSDLVVDSAYLAGGVLGLLAELGQTLATAESLTGGLVASTLVGVPGASAVFRGGLVVYATELKARLAGVSETLLDAVGPVHPDVAVALATGAQQRCSATWGVGTTGVAGPDSQDGHPVGTVFVGISGPQGRTAVRQLALAGDRAQIRAATVLQALRLLGDQLGVGVQPDSTGTPDGVSWGVHPAESDRQIDLSIGAGTGTVADAGRL